MHNKLWSRYQKNKPILIETGWLGHMISVVLWQNKLIIGNRGGNAQEIEDMPDKYYGTRIYNLDKNLDVKDVIFKFLEFKLKAGVKSSEVLEYIEDDKERYEKELYYIRNFECVNKMGKGFNDKEWRKNNRDKLNNNRIKSEQKNEVWVK